MITSFDWGRVEFNLRPTVSRLVCLGVGPPFGAHYQILHVLWSDMYLFFHLGVLSEERTSLYFAVHITYWSESRRTHNHILLSHLRLGSLLVASYDSQGYGGGILTRLHTGLE
jgi:hypothetical protein